MSDRPPPTSQRPVALPVSPGTIPDALKDLPQWVDWRYVWKPDQHKWDKPPVQSRTGRAASSTNPKTWSSFAEALDAYQRRDLDGIGLVLRKDNGMTGIDLDHCRDPNTGAIDPWALAIVRALDTYTEVSPSGEGLRLWVEGQLPAGGRKKGNIEVYDQGRYLTVTGNHLRDTPPTIEPRQAAIDALYAEVFARKPERQAQALAPHDNGHPPVLGDDQLLEKALAAKNGAKFARLWAGDTSDYPSPSEADLALCALLGFWTQDPAQVDRLFRRSTLYRGKWDEGHGEPSYGARTIATALGQAREHWTPGNTPVVLPLSDLTNAETLVRWHGDDLRYCHPSNRWYVYKHTHWKPDATAEVMRRAKQTIKRLAARLEHIEDDEKAGAWLNHIKKSLSVSRLKGMVELAASEVGIPVLPEQLDADPWLLNCLNGTIDLRTGRLRPHHREDLITRVCPVRYDPEAHSELWDGFLEKILPDPKVRSFVQRAAGHSSSGDISEEKLFFPYGPTGTGKSTLLAAIAAALGDYATTADFESFLVRERLTGSPRNDIARLAGKRFVVSLEVDDGKHLAEALIKQLTGGDVVAARFLYHESFEFLPTFKLWLAANHRPIVRDDDDAIWRRILQIPFMEQIPKADQDPTVKARLRNPAESGAAILAWLVDGCLAWQHEGLNVPEAVEKTTEEYRQQMDPLSEFLDEYCLRDPTASVNKTRLWDAYQERTKTRAGQRILQRREFTTRLRAMGFDEIHREAGAFWLGLKLR